MAASAASVVIFLSAPKCSSPKMHSPSASAGKRLGSSECIDPKIKCTSFMGLQRSATITSALKVNGVVPGTVKKRVETKETGDEERSAKSRISMFPDWSMLLAALATIMLAAEKQWTNFDWRPKKPEMLDMFGEAISLGRFVEDNLVFRQNFSIRSYEVGADKRASIETLMNHLQETALSHVRRSGICGDGFGATLQMNRKGLIWVVARMQIFIERYPFWGDLVEIDTWVGASGKNGMRRDWVVRDSKTGQILTRATSTWVMMNRKTRKLSKLPDAVRKEIQPFFNSRTVFESENTIKLHKVDGDNAPYVLSDLTPHWSDLDVNQHVNNVKYIGWLLQGLPLAILEKNELANMVVEFRHECGPSSILQSLTGPLAGNVSERSSHPTDKKPVVLAHSALQFAHMLRLQNDKCELLRAITEWRPKANKTINSFA